MRPRGRLCAWALTASALVAAGPAAGHDGTRLRFDHLTVEQGLANSWVVAVLEDRRGFMWFGTMDGLSRYDGARVVTYRHDDGDPASLPGQRVAALFEDSEERLWIALQGRRTPGLAVYDREQDAFRSVTVAATVEAPAGQAVFAIAEDRRGELWLGTERGLYHAALEDPPPPALARAQAALLPDTAVRRLLRDTAGNLWAGTARGLFRVDPQARGVRPWPQMGNDADLLASADVRALYEDTRGTLWIGTTSGLFRLGPTGAAKRYTASRAAAGGLATNTILSLSGDGHDLLYVGTENGGLHVLDTRSERFTRYVSDAQTPDALGGDSIYALQRDDQGTLWAGTFNAGVDYSSPWAHRFDVLTPGGSGLSGALVSAVMQDRGGNVWVGTDGDGLNRIEVQTGRVTRYRHDPSDPSGLASNAILALHEDDGGRLWVGSWAGGVQVLDPRSGRFTSFRHDARDSSFSAIDSAWLIRAGPDGRFLVSGQNGELQWLDSRTGKFSSVRQRYPRLAPGRIVNAVAWDRNDGLWLVHADAERLDLATGEVEVLRFEGAESIYAVHVDTRGNAWFGTRKAGLYCREHHTGALRHYGVEQGLPSNYVATILEDDSRNLWLGTGRGLVKLAGAVDRPQDAHIESYDVRDGLPGYEFVHGAAFRSPSGEMFFGGTRGLTRFFPERLERNPHMPPVVLTGLRILNRPVTPRTPGSPLRQALTETEVLTLSPSDSVVTFEFAALNFVLPRKNRYRYKLEGFDHDFIDAGGRGVATYTNLEPGTYRLRVAGANNDGVWNEGGATLVVVQRPRFYRTRAFMAGLGLLVLAGALGVHRLRVRSHVRLEAQLQARLTVARSEIRMLSGLLPVCTDCKKVRDDDGYWGQIEAYVTAHSEADFSHGICPDCRERMFAARPEQAPGH